MRSISSRLSTRALHALGVQVRPGELLEHDEGHVVAVGLLVGALAGEGVEDVRRRDDARLQRDRIAREAVRIARSVHALVVVQRDAAHQLRVGERLQAEVGQQVVDDRLAAVAVGAHHVHLVGREAAGLEQDRVGNADLADVVQRRVGLDALDPLVVQACRSASARAIRRA